MLIRQVSIIARYISESYAERNTNDKRMKEIRRAAPTVSYGPTHLRKTKALY